MWRSCAEAVEAAWKEIFFDRFLVDSLAIGCRFADSYALSLVRAG
jgi:hypothetical protein